MKHANYKNILKGVSTLDAMKKNLKATLFLVILIAFSANVFGGHSTLDIVDPTFNPQVQTNAYGLKWVSEVQVLPDGKILALGGFNTYNRVPVGKLVRLNADGSLDTTFNNQTVTASQSTCPGTILIQPDGKIVLRCVGLVAGNQEPKPLLRLNADGTFDSSFNFPQTNFIGRVVMDSLGRLLLLGDFTTPNGARRIVRLNDDGSLDKSFNFTLPAGSVLQNMTIQGNKLLVITDVNNNRRIYRLNEDGSEDASFTPFTGTSLGLVYVQPGNKILYNINSNMFRLNENGGSDNTFQPVSLQVTGSLALKFTGDGKIVTVGQGSPTTFRRYLPDGAVDPSFSPYTTTAYASYTILSDDSIVMGDADLFSTGANNFIRLTPGGVPDPTFNPGGGGFKTVLPGVIEAIETYPNGKILLGGKFDLINDFSRYRLARLNADSTVDTTFQVNTTSGSGNYFSVIRDIYQISLQADGKMVVSGFFDYVLGGETKKNIVRLNSDGSIDSAFNLTFFIPDYSQILIGGQNRFATYNDGKLMVGTSRANNAPSVPGPTKLTEGGARDTSFNPTLNGTSPQLYFDDVAIQPDGKIIAGGSYDTNTPSGFKSFIARYNSNGTLDSTFSYVEEPGRIQSRIVLLPGGKILIGKYAYGGGSAKIQRLNSDGSADTSFNSVLLSDSAAKINALLVLANKKIFVGGKFTISVNGQQNMNLLKLDEDGNFEPTTYNLNDEVLCLAADSQGRILVGGGFTVIDTNGGGGATRSYVARLTDSTEFDFDGDGKADISVFRPSENKWYILRSSDGLVTQQIFALSGDVPVPSDYDGDGKTDMTIYRPSSADWWSLSTFNGNQVYAHWGEAGVAALPSDFDGDGKSDYIFFLPANSTWYRYGSRVGASYVTFGLTGDKPVTGDFDGDGKTDVAIYRPSTGDWWWQSSVDNVQRATHWGIDTDLPAPGDYDGDGKTDFAVFRPSEGNWYVFNSRDFSYTILHWGIAEDKPVAADYDGDGKADIAVFRPSTGVWYLRLSTTGWMELPFGLAEDIPIPNAYIP